MKSPGNTIVHLEMSEPSAFRAAEVPEGFETQMIDPPEPGLNRKFYAEVGASWKWTDRLGWSDEDWRRVVCRDELRTFVGRIYGEEAGYFELESQAEGNVEIVYLGLLPEFIGKGLGGALLSAAVERAWRLSGARRVWVHTCSFDHEHALENYLKRGFEVFHEEPI